MLGIKSVHKHIYKKVGYYVMTYSAYGQDIKLYTRLQCSCSKHKKQGQSRKLLCLIAN